MRTRLCLVRHGETGWNVERRLQGHLDIALNARGREQAIATADALSGHRFEAVYSSDLVRAKATAALAAERLGLRLETSEALRERNYGAFQGLTYDEAEVQHPQAYARFKARELAFPIPGGGESLDAFSLRIVDALSALAQRHPGKSILVVTHGGVLDIAHRLAAGKPLKAARDFLIPNAALNWIAHENGSWQLEAWAQQAHLDRARDELPNA